MSLFRKFFYRKPPDGLLEISERVFVFDCCFSTDALEADEYKAYVGGIVGQLQEHFPDASFMVFNFKEGEKQTQISDIVMEYDMPVMDYPRHYEGCPLLSMEMIHHFLKSSDNWLSLQQNMLLMHCERGGWPVLAFMLAGLLIYRKQFSGENKTLTMIHKQAPHELLQLLSPLNPLPSQLRYLQYISRRNVGSDWPPLDRALTLDCVILRTIPNFDGEGGCRPIFRIYGQDPFVANNRTPKLLFSMPKKSKSVRLYKQGDCELVKIDICCHIQGDVVLECISLDEDLEREKMMFRVMFNTAFIRSNILMLNRDEIDTLWNTKDLFSKDFRAEVLLSEMDAAASVISMDVTSVEEKEGLPMEAFAKVHEIFSYMDWLDPKGDAALNMLQKITASNAFLEKLAISSPRISSPRFDSFQESAPDTLQEKSMSASENKLKESSALALRQQYAPLQLKSSPDSCLTKQDLQPHEVLNVVKQRTPPSAEPALDSGPTKQNDQPQIVLDAFLQHTQASVTSQQIPGMSLLNPASYSSSLQGSSLTALGVTSLLHDHIALGNTEVAHQVTTSSLSTSIESHLLSSADADAVTSPSSPFRDSNIRTSQTPPPPPPPPPLPSSQLHPAFKHPPPNTPPSPHSGISLPGRDRLVAVPPPPPLSFGASSSFSGSTVDKKKSSTGPLVSPPPPTNASKSPPPPPPPPPPPHSPANLGPPLSFSGSDVGSKKSSPPLPPPPPRSASKPSLPPPLPPVHSGPAGSTLVPSPPPPPHLASNSKSDVAFSISSGDLANSSQSLSPGTTSPQSLPADSKGAGSIVKPPPPATGIGPTFGPPVGIKGRVLTRSTSPRNPLSVHSTSKRASLKPLHWVKVTRAMRGSLWDETQKHGEAIKAPEFDMSELESLFSAAVPNSDHRSLGQKSTRRASLGSKPDRVQLIDLRRANNCEIMLTKIKIPLPDLLSALLTLDDSILDADQVDNLIKFCPTKEEMDLLKGYNGDKVILGKCEQFFLELMKVPRVESKLRVFSFKIQFKSQVSDLSNSLNIVNSAAEEIKKSIKLKGIMQTILSLGNALNQGTARGSAIGFRLDSLLKLADTRARNNKMTLMHYLCKVITEKLPELLDFDKDLVSLEAASKIQLKFLAEEMQAISKGLEKVEQELTEVENDGPISDSFRKTLKDFLAGAEADVRSITSLYSGVGRNADALAIYFGEDPIRCPFEQVVSTLLSFVKMFERAYGENCKQIELEKKTAQKEAESEKLKISTTKKESEQVLTSTVRRNLH